ncbi:ATP-dependent DNA helicase PIF1 [Elysia marginata]|uniref:ATP-dependent DNA helicase n=1 Tax=Elysia marginata TaxID=1093978 RepID=A0AAV4EEG6_9GAST|nr:ATP-dependent DNA helicase PIF1 [Elysia marginata]
MFKRQRLQFRAFPRLGRVLDLQLQGKRSEQPLCSIKKGTSIAKLIQDCSAIVVNEAPMLNKSVFEALDRTLQDINSTEYVMGGIPFLLCGDFRQILPVIRSGTRANIVNSCIKKSYLWRDVKQLKLTTNMRVHLHNDSNADAFAKLLLAVGDGKTAVVRQPNMIHILELGNEVNLIDELIQQVFPHFRDNVNLSQRVMLATLNDSVAKINEKLTNMLSALPEIYHSINTTLGMQHTTLHNS